MPGPNHTCPKCDRPAELDHTHCCKRCRSTDGREHGRNCTGLARRRRAPPSAVAVNPQVPPSLPELSTTWQIPYSTYRPSPTWTRKSGEDLRQFIHWFVLDGADFPHEKWQMLEWTFNNVDRTRPVILVPLSAHQHFSGSVLDCRIIDARGEYGMATVTGVDHKVIRKVCLSIHITSVLHDAVVLIETYGLRILGLRCVHATHRSVAICSALLMLAYPMGVCMPSTRRVQEAMHYWWLGRPLSVAEYRLAADGIDSRGCKRTCIEYILAADGIDCQGCKRTCIG